MGIQVSTIDSQVTALNVIEAKADSAAALIGFVRALAKRQARIDSAKDIEPRTLH
jgi:hypothetical protein